MRKSLMIIVATCSLIVAAKYADAGLSTNGLSTNGLSTNGLSTNGTTTGVQVDGIILAHR